ncbi:Spherulation-specific family 4-domain-containing protein [Phaeosphaeriaceae sp. PMI808]|nr:Spherulation-specific family 4-domain-containing protein [Phaeosphaeriaceae sp. PMI808]
MWYQLYPGKIGGIFFDEGWNDCGPKNVYSELYRRINDNTKRKYPGAYTVLNPGATMPKCFEHSADTLMTFESSYETYTTNYVPNDWAAADSRKLWHIIYNVPKSEVGRVAALARERGVGMIQITNDVIPIRTTTCLTMPTSGGLAASTPSGLAVTGFEYTSVSLSWPPAANAIGYRVYQDGQLAFNLTANMTRATLGNLSPGVSGYTFHVTAEGGDGRESGKSNSVSPGTKTPPKPGKYVFNMQVLVPAAMAIYTADIVVPYAFVRVYIWDSDIACDWTYDPGWPVNFAVANYVCTHYMVEGSILYKFSGTVPSGTVNVPWAWSAVGSVGVEQNGYTFTWTIPLGMPSTDTRNFVIQTESYGPKANVFQPCPAFNGGPQGAGNYCA